MFRSKLACAVALLSTAVGLLTACGGAPDRAEPPSGAVDPGIHGLAVPGEASPAARPHDPGAAVLAGVPRAAPAVGAPAAASPPETAGSIVMTREHCDTLGRKFTELTLAQHAEGETSTGDREASGVGKTFSDRCAREMVGQTVDMREYQCMLRATAPEELLGCKR